MSNELAVRKDFSYSELAEIAGAMSGSGYFSDAKDKAQAIVKILAGREMGFGPFASMTGVYIIQGRPSISANLMASAVKRSGRYDYRVIEMTDIVCELEYTQAGKPLGRSRFTAEDAKKAGTQNMGKFPRNMLFARAMSNGVRWYCPDVFDGSAVYTPEELGADVNEEGNVIDAKIVDHPNMIPSPANAIDPAKVKPIAAPAIPDYLDLVKAAWPQEGKVSWEIASGVVNSDEVAYVSLSRKDLGGRKLGIDRKLAKNGMTPEERAECELKRSVIDTLLALGAVK